MNKKTFELRLKKRELVWNVLFTSILIVILPLSIKFGWSVDGILLDKWLSAVAAGLICSGLYLTFVKVIDGLLRQTLLKPYWIEDHGDVIKLFGAVRLQDMATARLDVLAVKKGFKIVDEAYDKYGCTIAAVRASGAELKDKEKLKEMGITLSHI